ncbi:hypothetical protein, partial [Citrobacter portucalensis]|uniref:hypothetical protein n=1 Tax=Citrobacter portucalensis TaxID=1639133 RepID=UPI001E4201B2
MSNPLVSGYYETLLKAPVFSADPIGIRQSQRWQLIVDDIHHSKSESALREARQKAEEYLRRPLAAG